MNMDRCFSGDELAAALIDGSGARTLADLRTHAVNCESCRADLDEALALTTDSVASLFHHAEKR
jgi:hypothetical protein